MSPSGGKDPWTPNLRIQGRMQIFEKMSQMALNHVLILPSERAQKMLQTRLTKYGFTKQLVLWKAQALQI